MPSLPVLRSLQHREFRFYFIGQMVSLHGTWMQSVAQAWLVYRLTQSSLMLGLVSFCSLIPVLLFGLYGGVVADRLPRGKLFFAAQSLAMLQALALAGLTLAGHIQVWQIMLLAFLLGIVQAFEMPARHALIADLVPRTDLNNAIALNSTVFNVARFLGPTLAGVLVGWIGEGWVFLINGASFIGVLAALHASRIIRLPGQAHKGSTRERLTEGLRYAWMQRSIRVSLLMLATISLAGVPYMVLMPVFAKEVFHGDARTLGLLLGAAGAGALLGALRLAQRAGSAGLERLIGIAGVLGGAALIAFAATPIFGLALLLLLLTGMTMTTLVASVNTFIQTQVPDALRGRVMALFSVTFIGLAPLGNLAAGSMAQLLGAPFTVGLLGTVCVLGSVVFLRNVAGTSE